jgi:hypothetical protein
MEPMCKIPRQNRAHSVLIAKSGRITLVPFARFRLRAAAGVVPVTAISYEPWRRRCCNC